MAEPFCAILQKDSGNLRKRRKREEKTGEVT